MIWRSSIGSLWLLAAPAVAAAQVAVGGRGALRPYVHVLVAYAVVWILILVWVWWIARKLSRLNNGHRTPEQDSIKGTEGL